MARASVQAAIAELAIESSLPATQGQVDRVGELNWGEMQYSYQLGRISNLEAEEDYAKVAIYTIKTWLVLRRTP